jgi:nucleoside-diphosphate-sugar epimerase
MARALIVGCGCRGGELGRELRERGWQVRGTSRDPAKLAEIEASGIEAVVADPDLVASVLEQIEGVTLIVWLLGRASGSAESLAALHGPRLERVLEEIVDTPVRGFVYEAAGTVAEAELRRGARAVEEASRRWRIPVELVGADPGTPGAWREAMLAACERLVG